MMMGHDVRVGNTSTTVWVARMVMEKERLEGAEAAGGVVRQSEIWVLAPCMIKIRSQMRLLRLQESRREGHSDEVQ